ncbi:MAG: hypothetical protein GY934_02700 [Gammaproteobacteria bacterium]|nr:hypothetical protein [Gammaproteobacteria bacterium]
MGVLPQLPTLSQDQRRLLKLYNALDQTAQFSLLAFAEFLGQRESDAEDEAELNADAEPRHIPRPESESVVGAIKRLSSSYYMLDRSILLNETSSLMTAHLIHGRSAADVIDELEELFTRQYAEFRGEPEE